MPFILFERQLQQRNSQNSCQLKRELPNYVRKSTRNVAPEAGGARDRHPGEEEAAAIDFNRRILAWKDGAAGESQSRRGPSDQRAAR